MRSGDVRCLAVMVDGGQTSWWLADTYTLHSGPAAAQQCSVITPGDQPTPTWSTSQGEEKL